MAVELRGREREAQQKGLPKARAKKEMRESLFLDRVFARERICGQIYENACEAACFEQCLRQGLFQKELLEESLDEGGLLL